MFRRISGVCGLTFAVVFVIANLVSGEPTRTATKEEIARYLGGHQVSNEVGGALAMLISGVFALYAVGVWALLRSRQRDEGRAWPVVALVGGIVMTVNLALVGAFIAAFGRLGDSLSTQPILAQTVFTSYQLLATSIVPFIAIFLLGIGMATLESRAFPTWTAWLAFLGAALSIVLLAQSLWPGPVLDGIGIVHALVSVAVIAIVAIYMLLPQRNQVAYSAQGSRAPKAT
jgi:hypothetical protein